MRLPEWSDPDRRDAALERLEPITGTPSVLTKRELAVLFLLSHGVSHERTEAMLRLSGSTVERVVRSATDKLDAETTTHAVATALRLRLFE